MFCEKICYEWGNEQRLFDPWVYQRHVGKDMKKLPDVNLQGHGKQSITHLITSLFVSLSLTGARINLPYQHYSCTSPAMVLEVSTT